MLYFSKKIICQSSQPGPQATAPKVEQNRKITEKYHFHETLIGSFPGSSLAASLNEKLASKLPGPPKTAKQPKIYRDLNAK